LGLFYKKATNKGAIAGILVSIPAALLLKLPVLGLPFMDQMLYTFLITLAVIVLVSLSTNKNDDDPKAIILTNKIFITGKAFNVSAYAIMTVLVLLYVVFW